MLIAAIIFLLASATDLLDGYIARKRGQVTTLGILLDPVADKLLISSVFISLVQLGLAPAWMVVIIIAGNLRSAGCATSLRIRGFTIDASELGKIKMAAQVAAITLLLLKTRYPFLDKVGKIALYVVVIFALWSAVGYFRTFWTKIDDRFKQRNAAASLLSKSARAVMPQLSNQSQTTLFQPATVAWNRDAAVQCFTAKGFTAEVFQ